MSFPNIPSDLDTAMAPNPKHLILNLLMAADGPLTSREAVGACALFGIRENSVRVALVRLAAAGLPHEWRGREGEGAALALFSLEKAAYEVVYESGHRPDWVAVPLQGMLELTLHLLGGRP